MRAQHSAFAHARAFFVPGHPLQLLESAFPGACQLEAQEAEVELASRHPPVDDAATWSRALQSSGSRIGVWVGEAQCDRRAGQPPIHRGNRVQPASPASQDGHRVADADAQCDAGEHGAPKRNGLSPCCSIRRPRP